MKKSVVVSTVSVSVLETGIVVTKTFKVYGKVSTKQAVELANEKYAGMIVAPTVTVEHTTVPVEVSLPPIE